MKPRLAMALILTLLIGMLSVVFNVQRAKASGTIYIRADGSIDPPTASIYTADTVTYTLTGSVTSDVDGIVVERSNIVVNGYGYKLQGPGQGYGITVSGENNVTITALEISSFDFGVYFNASSGNIIGNTITFCNYDGMLLDKSADTLIIRNNITGTSYVGISLWDSSNNELIGNRLTGNEGDGIGLWGSSNNSITGNDMTGNSYGIYLDNSSNNSIVENTFVDDGTFVWGSYNNAFTRNSVNKKPLVYLEGASNFTVPDAGQVILINCSDVRVLGLDLSNASVGLQLWGTSKSMIFNNTITGNKHNGIWLLGSDHNIISGNLIENTGYGIFSFSSSNHNNVIGNNVSMNIQGGIGFSRSSSYNNITGNTLTKNKWHGLSLFESANSNGIGDNEIANNEKGIYIEQSSYNSIHGNNITSNNETGVTLVSSSNNRFDHNSFVNNAKQVEVLLTAANIWDDGFPSGGNYWSDYNGTDLYSGSYPNETGSDGIGDTEYAIDGYNTDHYPLMGMFSDFNATLEHHVQTICNTSITDFQFNGTVISFNVSGENDTTGFCRICIPTALMNGTYKVLVNSTQVSYNLLPCSNETYSYLYFNYTQSTQQVIIITEFPSLVIIPLFMIAILLAVIVYRKKHAR